MTQAIETKYLPATNTKGARIKATSWAGSITLPYDYSLNNDQMHAKAAMALVKKLEWGGTWLQGGNASATGYVFVEDWLGNRVDTVLEGVKQ